jgi:hypothetical protein
LSITANPGLVTPEAVPVKSLDHLGVEVRGDQRRSIEVPQLGVRAARTGATDACAPAVAEGVALGQCCAIARDISIGKSF